MNRENFR